MLLSILLPIHYNTICTSRRMSRAASSPRSRSPTEQSSDRLNTITIACTITLAASLAGASTIAPSGASGRPLAAFPRWPGRRRAATRRWRLAGSGGRRRSGTRGGLHQLPLPVVCVTSSATDGVSAANVSRPNNEKTNRLRYGLMLIMTVLPSPLSAAEMVPFGAANASASMALASLSRCTALYREARLLSVRTR